MRRSDKKTAFTLTEVILAVALMLGLIGGVLGFYRHVSDVRGRLRTQTGALAAERLVMERITGDLRAAMGFPVRLQGSVHSVSFLSASLPGAAAWAVRKSTEDPIPPEHDLQLVGYRLATEEDEDGYEVIVGLERTCQKIIAAPDVEEGEEISVALLTGRFKFLYLRYWEGSTWQETWTGRDLPQAIEITLGVEPLPEDTDPEEYEHEVFRRVVHVPAAKKAGGSGTRIIRGPGGGTRR